MPHKDPVKAKEYWEKYRASPANKEKQRRWKAQRHARMHNEEWRDIYYDANLRRLYGITIEDYNAMFVSQGGRCAICKGHQSEFKKRLGVDHCHSTGAVRGLLCHHCNHAIGKLKDSVDILQSAIEYLLRQPGGSEA